MSFLGLLVVAFCVVALFCGAINSVGRIVIALLKYVVLPAAALIATMGLLKYGF